MKYIYIILISLLLTSCSWFKETFVVEDMKEFHPSRPMPINMIAPEWRLVTSITHDTIIKKDEAYTFMCLSWEDYLVMGQNMQNIIKNLKDNEALLCYYRKDLKEPVCEKYNIKDKK